MKSAGEKRRRLTAVAAWLATAVSLLPGSPASADRRWGPDYFPNVPLVTQDGKTVRFYDDLLKGKSVAIDLIYTSCRDACPIETARMAQVQRLLGDRVGKDIFFYSISIDPKHDTPAVLKAYAEKFHAGPGWLFLTGKEKDIALISQKMGLSNKNDAASRDGHNPTLMLGNEPTGQWMRNSAVDNPRFLVMTIGNFLGVRAAPTPAPDYADAKPIVLDKGEYLFRTRCTACHTIGRGDAVGPDLAGVTTRRQRKWLARYLAAPDEMLDARDPIASALYEKYGKVPMPNLRLGEADVGYLISYLESQGQVSASAAP